MNLYTLAQFNFEHSKTKEWAVGSGAIFFVVIADMRIKMPVFQIQVSGRIHEPFRDEM